MTSLFIFFQNLIHQRLVFLFTKYTYNNFGSYNINIFLLKKKDFKLVKEYSVITENCGRNGMM